MKKKVTRSPYCKYQKVPRKYSPLYYQWRAARFEHNQEVVNNLAKKHTEHWLGEEETQDWEVLY